MSNFSVSALLLRFVLGGLAVVLSTLTARWIGGKAGGIFAAFPAVYLAALLGVILLVPAQQAVSAVRSVSAGALVGMTSDIICAIAAIYFIPKKGWAKGLFMALIVWAVAVVVLYTISFTLGLGV
ncbi:DUF3147 family protein [Desulforamulus reducens]|nr:DUF3147 family protein [Desulforamulus reducens]